MCLQDLGRSRHGYEVETGAFRGLHEVVLSVREAPLRELVLADGTGVEFQLFAPGGSVYPGTLMGATAHLRQAFSDARHHARHRELFGNGPNGVDRPAEDPDWAVLSRVANGELPMFWRAETRDDLNVLEELKLKREALGIPQEQLWIEAGYDADKIAQMKVMNADELQSTSNIGGELLRAFERGDV